MRRNTFVTVIALLAALFAVPAFAAATANDSAVVTIEPANAASSNEAAMKNWRLAGLWQMTAEIPETTIQGSKFSAEMSGKFVPYTTTDSATGKEKPEYMIYSFSCSYTIDGKTTELDPIDNEIAEFENPQPYTPGETLRQTHESTDPQTGDKYTKVLSFVQTGENEMHGVLQFYLNGELVAVGTATATRPTWKIAGKWNYTTKIDEMTLPTGSVVSATETGTMLLKMKSGEMEGKEYFDTVDVKYKATYKVDGEEATEEDEILGVDISDVGMYDVGGLIVQEFEEEYGGVKYTERLECYQTEENKIVGKVYMVADGINLEIGSIEATRKTESSSSGGCNAGAAAAMLMFCAVPVFFRRKK